MAYNPPRVKGKFAEGSGREFATIVIDGQDVRPKDAMWVVTNPDGVVVDGFASDVSTRDDISRAARSYWSGQTEAILALNAGWRIKIVTRRTFLRDIAPKMQPEE